MPENHDGPSMRLRLRADNHERLESDSTMLVRIDDKPAAPTKAEKSMWYSNLLRHSRQKGWKDGWASHKYKKRFGVWPKGLSVNLRAEIVPEVANWIKSQQIARDGSQAICRDGMCGKRNEQRIRLA
jgi:hypothetical protein